MNLKLLSAVALLSACAFEHGAFAQTAVPQDPSSGVAVGAAAAAPCCKLPALTTVELEIVTPASSKTSRQGEPIRLRVVERISVDGKVVIPEGTEGEAEVVQASRGAFGGKAGELVIGVPYLMLGQQRIGLKRLRYGASSGRDQTGTAMMVSALAGGVFGLAVGGGNIDIAGGTRANAVVTTDTFVPVQP